MDSTAAPSISIDRFSSLLSAEEWAQALRRLLRVPQAWEALADEATLEDVCSRLPASTLTPGLVAVVKLGLNEFPVPEASLVDDLEANLEQVWNRTLAELIPPQDLIETALLSIAIDRESQRKGAIEEISQRALEHPLVWRPALSCNWPTSPVAAEYLQKWLASGAEGFTLAAWILLANFSFDETARILVEHSSDHAARLIQQALQAGEKDLAGALARGTELDSSKPDTNNVNNLLAEAMGQIAGGEGESAQTILGTAWTMTAQLAGQIADWIAVAAEQNSEPIVAAEAWTQALEIQPSPNRRARLALCCHSLGRMEEARNILPSEPVSLEEMIALGIIQADAASRQSAIEILLRAVDNIQPNIPPQPYWLLRLIKSLADLGEMRSALELSILLADWCPPDEELHQRLAELQMLAGEPEKAVVSASMALALAPEHESIKALLARSYDMATNHEAAIVVWTELCESNPTYRLDLASSSLLGQRPEQAMQAALDILEDHPESIEAKTIVGSALTQLGQHKEALEYLEEAVASAPYSPQAWMALSDCQSLLGDIEAEHRTLQAGLGSIPDSSELQSRMARNLLDQDQLDSALGYIVEAVRQDDSSAKHYSLQARILKGLDRNQDALAALSKAYRIEPSDWANRVELAREYGEQDQLLESVKLLDALPKGADVDAHELAARIFSMVALNNDHDLWQEALSRIEIAQGLGASDPWFTLQQARILDKHNHPGPAFFAYQQFVNLSDHHNRGHLLEATLGVARTALQTDQAVVAIASLEQGQQNFPDSTEIMKMLAPAYICAGMNQRALATARQAVELSPDNPELLRILSDAAAHNHNWDEAIQCLEKIVSQNPHNTHTWIAIADVSLTADRPEKARQALACALRQDSKTDPELLQQCATLVERMNNNQFAQRLLVRAFSLCRDSLNLACRLAELSQQLGDLDTAQQAWMRAADLQPEEASYLDNAAEALWHLGRRSKAIGTWQRSVAVEPSNAPLRLKLAHALLKNGEIQTSIPYFQQALEEDPHNLEILLDVGKAIVQYGSPDEAVLIFERAKSVAPDSIDASLGLARCWLQMNEPAQAREILEAILQSHNDTNSQLQANAMLALAALQMGDLPVAARSFQHAMAKGKSDRELDLWLSRAALRMARWEDALEILERDRTDPTPERVVERLACRLRIEDARWLYGSLANAWHHAPKNVAEHNQGQIADLLSRLENNVGFSPWMEEVRTWRNIQQSLQDPSTDLDIEVDQLERPELVHAAVIGLMRNDESSRALDLLDQTQLAFDTDLWGALLQGVCQLRAQKPSLARETLQTATKNPVISPIATYFISQAWLAEGDIQQALSGLNAAVSAWSDEPEWHFELALLYQEQHQSDAALAHFQRAAELDPKDSHFALAYARCLREAGHLRDAVAAFAHVIKNGEPNVEVLKEAGLAALANGDSEHAHQWLFEVAAQQPDDAQSLVGAARAALNLGDKTRAHDLAQAAYRLAPKHPDVLMGLAEIEAGKGKLEHALDYFDQALNVSQDQASVQIARSKLLLANRRPLEAIDALERAAELNPDDDRALCLLAEAYESIGKLDQAMTIASRAHTIAPLRPAHRLQLGRICRKAGQLDRAVDELSRAEQDHPTDPSFPLELGKAYQARAQFKRALQSYRRAISLNPTLAEPHYRAGLLLKSQKAYAQACQMFEKASELNPNDADILHQLAAVRALSLVHGGIPRSAVST